MHTFRKKIVAFMAILILVIAIPFTVYIAEQQKEIRQRASTTNATITVNPTTTNPGNTVTVSWTIGASDISPTLPPAPIQTIPTAAPPATSDDENNNNQINPNNSFLPIPKAYAQATTTDNIITASPNPCVLGTNDLCTTTITLNAPQYDNLQIIIRETNIPFTGVGAHPTGSYDAPWITATGITFDVYAGKDNRIGSVFVKGIASKTRVETLQLYNVDLTQEPKPIGPDLFLNCKETKNTPPPTTASTGSCSYPIPKHTTPGSYIIRMLAADGTTILGESNIFRVIPVHLETRSNRFIVTFRSSVSPSQRLNTDSLTTNEEKLSQTPTAISTKSILVETLPGHEKEIMAAYKKQPDVVEVVPDYLIPLLATPNDPLFPQQDGLQTIKAPPAWDSGQGEGIKIAILDTGIADHPDLQDRMGLQKDFYGKGITPTNPHGTQVAGIAAATYNNNMGITGTAGKSIIMNAKVGENTISSINAIEAIIWATDNNAKVINMSFGMEFDCFQAFQDAINYARQHGVVVIAGAGNDGQENMNFFPANCTHVISVGATNAAGSTKTSFSNFGTNVPLAAPGVNQLSTDFNNTYIAVAGTSISTPFVTGIAALILAKYPGISPDFVRDRLFLTATPVTGFTHGLVNAEAAVLANLPTPTVIPTVTPTPPMTPSPTPTPIPNPCIPRPKVNIQNRAGIEGPGTMQVTVTTTTSGSTINSMREIRFGTLLNSSVQINNQTIMGNSTMIITANTQTVTFVVRTITPGKATFIPFTVVDSCGDWKTFVGGGPNAF